MPVAVDRARRTPRAEPGQIGHGHRDGRRRRHRGRTPRARRRLDAGRRGLGRAGARGAARAGRCGAQRRADPRIRHRPVQLLLPDDGGLPGDEGDGAGGSRAAVVARAGGGGSPARRGRRRPARHLPRPGPHRNGIGAPRGRRRRQLVARGGAVEQDQGAVARRHAGAVSAGGPDVAAAAQARHGRRGSAGAAVGAAGQHLGQAVVRRRRSPSAVAGQRDAHRRPPGRARQRRDGLPDDDAGAGPRLAGARRRLGTADGRAGASRPLGRRANRVQPQRVPRAGARGGGRSA